MLLALIFIIAVVVVVFNILLFLLPLIVILIIVGYLFRMLNKLKKGKNKDFINIKYKVR